MDQPPAQNSLANAWFAARETLDLPAASPLVADFGNLLAGRHVAVLVTSAGRLASAATSAAHSWGSRGRQGVGTIGAANRRPAGYDAGRVGLSVDADENSAPSLATYFPASVLIPVAMLAQLPLAELKQFWPTRSRHTFAGTISSSTSGKRRSKRSATTIPRSGACRIDSRRTRALLRRSRRLRSSATPFATGEHAARGGAAGREEIAARIRPGGGSLQGRILRLFGQPSPPSSAAGLLAGVLLPGVALASLLAAFALGAPGGRNNEKKPAGLDTIEQLSGPLAQDLMPQQAVELQASLVPAPKPESIPAAKPARRAFA